MSAYMGNRLLKCKEYLEIRSTIADFTEPAKVLYAYYPINPAFT